MWKMVVWAFSLDAPIIAGFLLMLVFASLAFLLLAATIYLAASGYWIAVFVWPALALWFVANLYKNRASK